MNNLRDVLSMSILAGLALAVILNAGSAATIVDTVSNALLGLIRTVSGTDPSQKKGIR